MARRFLLATLLSVLLVAACSSSGATDSDTDPTVTFNGNGCSYDGAETFDLSSEETFVFVNNSELENVTFGVWTVPDGTNLTPVSRIYATSMFETGGDRRAASYQPTAAESETPLTVVFDTPGTWALVCRIQGDGVEFRHTLTVSTS